MQQWIWRIKSMLGRKSAEAESAEEMQLHFDLEVENGREQGLDEAEARRRARLRAGLVSEALESRREEFGFRSLTAGMGDLRHAFRSLTRNGGFGAVALAVLTACVAITTLIFCMLEGVVLRPLPYASPERLVRLYDVGRTVPKFPMSMGHYLDVRANARAIESIALYTARDAELTVSDGHPERLIGLSITGDYFSTLSQPPALGRAFQEGDLRKNVKRVIISYQVWQQRFHGDPAIIGRAIRLDREPFTVIGVAPRGFQHVGGDYRSPLQGETVDVWFPLGLDVPEQALRAYHFTNAIARLRSGFTEEQARQDLSRSAGLYAQRYANYGKWGIRLEPLLSEVTGRSRRLVWLLMAAGGLVMLVACANIAGLCVARAVSRRRELALRHALGANGWQLMRVGLAENLLIGVAGGLLGLALAAAALPLLRQLLPTGFPRSHEIAFTGTSAAFAAALAIASALLAGVLPLLGGHTLLADSRMTSNHESMRLRMALVAGEIALAGLLCAGAIFFMRSYQEIGARDHGFRPEGALTFELALPRIAYAKPGDVGRTLEAIRAKILAVPGVASVGAATSLPWSGYDENTTFGIVGGEKETIDGYSARFQAASAGYFEAVGMRLRSGRFFDHEHEANGKPLGVIVNEALANRFLAGANPLDKTLDIFGDKRRIVGVVSSVNDSPADLTAEPTFWFPLEQMDFGDLSVALRVNAGVDPASLTSAASEAVHAVDPQLALTHIRTMQQHAARALAPRTFALWLFEAFAFLSLLLSAAGIYGLLAYLVQQRRKEFGIRLALGASRTDLLRMIVFDGLKMSTAGALLCALLIPVGGGLLQSFLYNVKSYDFVTLAGAPAALLIVALLATLGPAQSATRSDPSVALRDE